MGRKLKGFTIIELLIVITIIAVLCAIGVPAVLTWVRDARIRTANEQAQLVYAAVQDYLTELEIKNVDLKVPGSTSPPKTMLMHSCSTDDTLPNPISGASRNEVAEYGAFDEDADVNSVLKGKGINFKGELGDEFEGVWAVKFNMNTYTVVEAYWTPYLKGAESQTNVTAAEAFSNYNVQETYCRNNGVVIGKYPI